jgi:hypothetical protein
MGFCGADGKCRRVIKALGPDFIKRMGSKLMDESIHHENMRMMYCLILRYLRHVKCNERISYTQCWTEDQRQFVLDMREEGIRLAVQIRLYYPKLVRSLLFPSQGSGGCRVGIVYRKLCCNGDREKPFSKGWVHFLPPGHALHERDHADGAVGIVAAHPADAAVAVQRLARHQRRRVGVGDARVA